MRPEYLAYAIRAQEPVLLSTVSRGATVHRLETPKLAQLLIPVPPLAEQERIVRILDEAFDGIAAAQANSKANLEKIDELFTTLLNGTINRASAGLPNQTFGDLLEMQPRNGWSPPASTHSATGTPVLTLSAVTGFEYDRLEGQVHERRDSRVGALLVAARRSAYDAEQHSFVGGPRRDLRRGACGSYLPRPNGPDVLSELAQLIDAAESDLFDVLSYVAYAATPKTRAQRAEQATLVVDTRFLPAQTVFLHFVLSHYVDSGVEELATEKLAPLLKLKYGDSIQDAIAQVGPDIGVAFTGFQRYLYEPVTAQARSG